MSCKKASIHKHSRDKQGIKEKRNINIDPFFKLQFDPPLMKIFRADSWQQCFPLSQRFDEAFNLIFAFWFKKNEILVEFGRFHYFCDFVTKASYLDAKVIDVNALNYNLKTHLLVITNIFACFSQTHFRWILLSYSLVLALTLCRSPHYCSCWNGSHESMY